MSVDPEREWLRHELALLIRPPYSDEPGSAWHRRTVDAVLAYFADPAHGLTVETSAVNLLRCVACSATGLACESLGETRICCEGCDHDPGRALPAHGLVRDEPSEGDLLERERSSSSVQVDEPSEDERPVRHRHLRPHAEFGDTPDGSCGCAGCDPRDNCGCPTCLNPDAHEPSHEDVDRYALRDLFLDRAGNGHRAITAKPGTPCPGNLPAPALPMPDLWDGDDA